MLRSARVGCVLAKERALAFTLPLLCVWSACADERDAPPELELELGSGEASFEPAHEGDHLPLYAGTQGGHHVWLSMRVRGFHTRELRMILDVVPSEPAPAAHTEVQLHFAPVVEPAEDDPSTDTGEGALEFVGWPARVLAPECAVGKPVRLSVQLEDDQGHTVKGELDVVADPPALGFASACAQ